MRIKIPYGRKALSTEIEDSRVAGIIRPNPVETGSEKDCLNRALNNPLKSSSFEEFISGEGKTLFIVNDGTRPTPTAKVLNIITDHLKGRDIDFIIATGVHRAPTEEEYRFIFGDYLENLRNAGRIFVHDAKKDDEMEFIGTSANGTEMWINKRALNADRIVIIGSVEPHYFAGYTGGRKAFLPGLASYKTITQNHKYALRPEAKALALKGNPVHEDMIDALKTLKDKKIFSIQTVLDREHRIYAATAGDIFASMDAAVEFAKDVFTVSIPRKEDIVVTVAPYPMDVDLYQSLKSLENGRLALRRGGILIMVASCRAGIGPDTFYNLISRCDTPVSVMENIRKEYKLGYHKAAGMMEVCAHSDVWALTDLEPEVMKKIFVRPVSNIQEAVNAALEIKGPEAKVLFLLEGSVTVPNIREK